MPANPPLVAAGARDPEKPRPIPAKVRRMVELMVYGNPDDQDSKCIDFIEAARIVGIKPDIARRWLDRAEVRRLLRAERRAFRDAICAANELSLQRIRDRSSNSMAQLGAVRLLENIAEENESRPLGRQVVPGLVLVVTNGPNSPPEPVAPVIDVEPVQSDGSASDSRDRPKLPPARR